MYLRRLTASVLLLSSAALISCEGRSCNPQQVAEITESGPQETLSPADVIPVEAQGLVEVGRLDGFLQIVAALTPQLPEHAQLRKFQSRWMSMVGFDPYEARSWSAWGVDTAGDSRLFNVDGRWFVHARLADSETFERWLVAHDGSKFTQKTTKSGGYRVTSLVATGKSQPFALIAASDEFVFVSFQGEAHPRWTEGPPPQPLTVEAFSKRIRDWSRRETNGRFVEQQWVKDYAASLKNESLRVFAKPAKWFEASNGTGQEATIHSRMLAQMGPLGFSLGYDVMRREISIRALSMPEPGEPAFVESLGVARGELPVVGGLADPGVIGMVRVSVDPERMYALIRSLLEPTVRTDLDAKLAALKDELKIDVQKDVLANLQGNAVMVIYGVDSTKLSPTNSKLASDIFGLRATREAILVPIDDSTRIGGVLDALTTLSKGKLNRKKTASSVQYAWIEDGALEWAILLSTNYAVFVDSTAAFDHAVAYERAARPLSDILVERGVGRLVEGKRSGVYLDTQALASIMAETGSKEVSDWLGPFQTFVLTTEDRDPESETIITLRLTDPSP